MRLQGVMRVFIPLLLSLPLLQACELGLGVGASAYSVANSRPDRLLTYEIDVQLDDRVLVFNGSTHCEHEVILPQGVGSPHHYSTNDRYAYLNQKGEQWILEGIDCNSALHGIPRENYRLYKQKNDKDAELFFVTKDGPVKVTRTIFDSRVTVGSKDIKKLPRYNVGPYAFRKTFLKDLPPPLDTLLASRKDVTVVRTFASLLCRNPDGNEPVLDVDQYRMLLARLNMNVVRVETGYLVLKASARTWELRPSQQFYGPLDVTTWEPDGRNWHPSFDPSLVTCLPISLSGANVLLHANAGAGLVYIPNEKAIFTIQPLRHPHQPIRDARGRVELWGY
jgi:hypothetical protein